jgi:hypothetical protein
MDVNYFKAMLVIVVLFTGIFVRASAAETADVRRVSGEIVSMDLKLGTFQLKSDTSRSAGDVIEYRVDQNANRIMNFLNKNFLSIEDLQPGQHVIIEVINNKKGQIVKKIIMDPDPAYQRANEKAGLKRSGKAFNSEANKKFRAKMLAEKKAAEAVEAEQKAEDAQDKGEGQVKVKF